MQTTQGGFAYWPGGGAPHLYGTAYATWVLHLARQAGYAVPEAALKQAAEYLKAALTTEGEASDEYHLSRQTLALLTLGEMGIQLPNVASSLVERRSQLPVFGRALLLLALSRAAPGDPAVAALMDEILANMSELPATAHVTERLRYRLDGLFYSEARSDAMALWALARTRPEHPVLAKLARGLLERRSGAAWRNTQENAYALLALSEYARRFEPAPPNLVARAWLGQAQVTHAHLHAGKAASATLELPLSRLLQERDARLVLGREGSGRLYYRIGLTWAPQGSVLPSREQGFRVERTLRTPDGPLPLGKPLLSGEPVMLDLVIENRTLQSYVAIDVPLPAGLEALQRDLGRGQAAQMLHGARGAFVSHEELRPDRVLVFADELPPGTHRHSVALRATTKGIYALPPALAQAMYTPEVYGRSAGNMVEVR
jgi:hypothetical protein